MLQLVLHTVHESNSLNLALSLCIHIPYCSLCMCECGMCMNIASFQSTQGTFDMRNLMDKQCWQKKETFHGSYFWQ